MHFCSPFPKFQFPLCRLILCTMRCFRGTVKPENSTETKVTEGDVEKQCEEQCEEPCEGSPVKAEAPRCCSLQAKILSIFVGFALLAGAATAALWPRDPNWSLTNLDVLDESALMYFVMAFGNGGFKNDTALPEVIFRAGATLENPNLIGGRAASGEFQVFYKDKVLGGGQSEPVAIPALGSGSVEADIRVKLNPDLLQELIKDVLQNSLHTTVKVRGGAQVKSIFGLQLNCRMDCDIDASVTELFGETKQAVVESKNCSYTYF
eukprot:s151_g21.t1